MAAIDIGIWIDAEPETVWRAIESIQTHTTWMADAVAIRFLGDQRQGTGTRFECDTKVGPFKVVDVMEITEWEPAAVMGVRHQGLVTGEGRFTLEAARPGTQFAWYEELSFPWYLGGVVTATASTPILKWVWRRNLRALKAAIETHNLPPRDR